MRRLGLIFPFAAAPCRSKHFLLPRTWEAAVFLPLQYYCNFCAVGRSDLYYGEPLPLLFGLLKCLYKFTSLCIAARQIFTQSAEDKPCRKPRRYRQ